MFLRCKVGGGYREYRGRLYEVGNAIKNGCFCERCYKYTKVPICTPCAHLLCNDCVLLSRHYCTAPSCETLYVMDSETEQVPQALIELQPGYETVGRETDWKKVNSEKLEHLIPRLLQIPLKSVRGRSSKKWKTRRAKVIIFSQFKPHLQLAQIKLEEVPELSGALSLAIEEEYFLHEYDDFNYDNTKWIMLMGPQLPEAEKLRTVEYIFILDPAWDASLENELISKVHRIGGDRNRVIHIEKLVMKHSVEHDTLLLTEKLRLLPYNVAAKSNTEASKRVALLKALRIVSFSAQNVDAQDMNAQVEEESDSEDDWGEFVPPTVQHANDEVEEEENNEGNCIVVSASTSEADDIQADQEVENKSGLHLDMSMPCHAFSQEDGNNDISLAAQGSKKSNLPSVDPMESRTTSMAQTSACSASADRLPACIYFEESDGRQENGIIKTEDQLDNGEDRALIPRKRSRKGGGQVGRMKHVGI